MANLLGTTTIGGHQAIHVGNISSYAGITQAAGDARYLQLTGGTLTGGLTITGGRLLAQTGGANTYGIVSGYANNNHLMTMRAGVSGPTASPTFTAGHQMTFVEYAQDNDITGWYFKSSSNTNYEEIARITRSTFNYNGNTVLHSGNYNSYSPTLTGGNASGTWSINISGTAARATRANGNFYIDDNYGNSIVGLYNSTILQGVFAMGDAYKLTAGGGAGNLYGLAWSHPNAGGVAANLNTHGLLVMENGTFLAAVSGSIRARDDMRAPIFYDSQDTNYYVDPNGMSKQVQLTNLGTYGSNAANARNHFVQYNAGTATPAAGWIAAAFGDADANRVVIGQWGSTTQAIIGSHTGSLNDWAALGYAATEHIFYAPSWTSSEKTKINSDGIYAPAYRGNANVGGTGTATWHPDGIYTGGAQWMYGVMYKNNTAIYDISEMTVSSNISITGTNTTPINITGSAHKYLTINPGNGYEAMVRYVGGSGSSWYVGKRTSDQLIGTQSFHFYSEAAAQTVGGINPSGDMLVIGSMRAPIFYDYNDTSYYLDPNSGSTSLRIAGGIAQRNIVGRPYAVWGASGTATGAVVIKFPGGSGNYGMIHAVIDIYEYSGNAAATVIVGGHNWNSYWVNYNAEVVGQTDKPVRVAFKDGKYCIVIGNSSSSWSYGQVVLRKIQNGTYYDGVMDIAGGYTAAIESDEYAWASGDLRNLRTPVNFYAGGIVYASGGNSSNWNTAHGWGNHAGLYQPLENQRLSTGNGPTFTNIYNSGWFRNNNNNEGLYNQSQDRHFYNLNGNWRANIGGHGGGLIIENSHNGAALMYVGYHDANGRGVLMGSSWWLNSPAANPLFLTIGGHENLNAHTSAPGIRLMFGGGNTDAQDNYYIGTNMENYGGNHTKLDLRWHTGIRMGAQPGYGGIRFFNNEDLGSRIMSIGETDGNVRIDNNLWIGGAGGWLTDLLAGKQAAGSYAAASHTHDDRYYTESESDGRYLYYRGMNQETDFQRFVDTPGVIRFDQANATGGFSNAPGGYTYGGVLSLRGVNFGFQLWGSHTGDFFYKTQWENDNYSGWRAVITALNIGSQSVNYATTAGTANAVAWTNVSSRPTALSQFTNDLGNYGGWLTTGGKAADSELIDGIDSSRIVFGDGDKKSTNFSDMNAYNQSSGFFFYNQPTGNPFSDWTNWINVMGNSWDNNYGFQIAHAFHNDGFAVRRVTNGSFASWRTIIDSGNIGGQSVSYATSAGNADTVDGKHATNNANNLAVYESNGYLYIPSWLNVNGGGVFSSTNNAHLRPNTGSYGAWEMIGSRNGWSGIFFNDSGDYLMANNNEVGHYQNGIGWKFRWYQGTMYVSRNNTGGGTEYTVLDSGNYSTWAIARGGDTVSSIINFLTNNGGRSGATDSAKLQAYSTDNNAAFMSFHKAGHFAINFGLDDDNVMRIGGWSAAANLFQMDMSGNLTMKGDVIAFSDARVKTDIQTIEGALQKTLKLRGVTYNRIDTDDDTKKLGVIAQEVLEVIPEVVSLDNNGTYGVSYGNLVGLLIEAIKEQQQKIDDQQAQIDELKKSLGK